MLVMDKVHEIGGIPTEASAFDNDDNEGNNEERDDANEPLRPEIAMKISADNPSSIIFKQLFELRMTQLKQGVDLSNLTRVQWGLAPLKFSHHIVIKESSIKEFPYMFEIIVCTACSPVQNSSSCPVFLGVYGDQESALLVSDVHEILNGRYGKLSILRREDAMFFHHLTARLFDESSGSLQSPAPVLSVLEKLRIDSAASATLTEDALDEKKRKRASSIDILIQSSLYLSMTSRESLSSSDEAENKGGGEEDEEGEEGEEDGNNAETEEEDGDEVGDEYNESCLYSSSSTCQNHAPFAVNSFPTARSHSPLSEETHTMTSTESRSMNISDSDADSSVFDDSMNAMATAAAAHSALTTTSFSPPITQHKKEFSNSQRQLSSEWESSWKLETQEELPRTRRTNRPRASTFSVSHTSSSQSLFDTEAERTPLGMITWLASLEEDDFVAAKLLAELSSKEKDEVQDPNKCDIPKYRGSRSKEKERDMTAALQEASKRRIAGMEPPTQRRRRANSVIEVTRQMKCDSLAFDEGSFDHGSGGRNPRTYRKDPNWASEGRSRGYVGAYSPAERRRRIERFLEKRRLRVWQKNVKYDVRKNFADSRVRVKGRFVKKEDQIALIALGVHSRNRSSSEGDAEAQRERIISKERERERDRDRDMDNCSIEEEVEGESEGGNHEEDGDIEGEGEGDGEGEDDSVLSKGGYGNPSSVSGSGSRTQSNLASGKTRRLALT